MKRIDWPGYIENGKLILTDEDGFKEHLKFFSGDIEVTPVKRDYAMILNLNIPDPNETLRDSQILAEDN